MKFITTWVDNQWLSDCQVEVRDFKDLEHAKAEILREIKKEFGDREEEWEEEWGLERPKWTTNTIQGWSYSYNEEDAIFYGVMEYNSAIEGMLFCCNVCEVNPCIPNSDSFYEIEEAIAEAKAHDSLDNRETDWDEVREGLSTFDGVGAVGEATHMYIPKSKWEVTS